MTNPSKKRIPLPFRTRCFKNRRSVPLGRTLSLESLESRRVLTTVITGTVVNDLNGNGTIEVGEPGQANVLVYLDANNNDMFDSAGTIVEPDDFASDTVMNSAVSGMTFSVADAANLPIANKTVTSLFDDDGFGSTGSNVFSQADVGLPGGAPFFNSFFRLRVDFDSPVSSVELNFSSAAAAEQTGIMEFYNDADELLGTYETSGLRAPNYETMVADRSEGDIAYIVAYTQLFELDGRFDALRINGAGSEAWTVTDTQGRYRMQVPGGGSYRLNEVVPEGFRQTSPAGDGGQTVAIEDDATVSNINFSNSEVINQAPVALDDQAEVLAGNSVVIPVLQNDSDDVALDPSTVAIQTEPANGTVEVNDANGAVTYTPASGFVGQDSFTYQVSDNVGLASETATVTVTVTSNGATSWHNADMPLDVNGDGLIAPIDALLIINELNEPEYRNPSTGELPAAPDPVPAYFDVDDDGFVSPTDAILIINHLNGQAAAAAAAATMMAEPESLADEGGSNATNAVRLTDQAAALSGIADDDASDRLKKRTLESDEVDAAFAD